MVSKGTHLNITHKHFIHIAATQSKIHLTTSRSNIIKDRHGKTWSGKRKGLMRTNQTI
uniref:Uncharacterized protein n=1 Tax=Rhizophora mucronata TaxID=61149 RepID=A0A2P2N2M6_RHIMU